MLFVAQFDCHDTMKKGTKMEFGVHLFASLTNCARTYAENRDETWEDNDCTYFEFWAFHAFYLICITNEKKRKSTDPVVMTLKDVLLRDTGFLVKDSNRDVPQEVLEAIQSKWEAFKESECAKLARVLLKKEATKSSMSRMH